MTRRNGFTLSTPRPRTELLASIKAERFASPPMPPSDAPASPAPADTAPKAGEVPDTVDTQVTQQILDLEKTLADLQKTQAGDTDAKDDPNDAKVEQLLGQIGALVAQLKAAQAADTDTSTNTPADKLPDDSGNDVTSPTISPKLAVTNTNPDLGPTDEKGNVAPEATCATDGCGHMASVHENLESGENSGACTMASCLCDKFADANTGLNQPSGDTGDGGGANNAGGDDAAPATSGTSAHSQRGGFAAGDPSGGPSLDADLAPSDEAGGVVPGDDEIEQPLKPGGLNVGPAFTIPVAIVEGIPTDDGRQVAPQATEWINAPWALMGLATSTHDPSGFDQNDPAVLCGWIHGFNRVPGPVAGSFVLEGTGNFLANDDGAYFANLLEEAGRMPVSADLMVMAQEVSATEFDEWGDPVDALVTATKARIEAVTILPFGPAFSQCYIVLGGDSTPEDIPQAVEEPKAMAASAQHWMTDTEGECEPCMDGLDVLTASAGPVRPPAAWFEDPKFTRGDGRVVTMIGQDKYGHMKQHEGVPITVTDEGEVYGHIAQWGICHIGQRGECITAPHSRNDYAFFKRGQHLITAEGETVRVGVLTANTGHASVSNLSAGSAIDHYDNTGLQVANVNIGEDEFGIWVHGAIRPEATEEQVQKLRASSQSGDWREIGGALELVASLTVSTPGFVQAVVAGGSVKSLVAAGAMGMAVLRSPESIEVRELSDDDLAKLARGPLTRLIRHDARSRLDALRRRDAQARISALTKR